MSYIDLNPFHNWACLPLLVLEKVFAYLGWRDRARAALVCKRWLNAFCSPNVWRKFTYYPPAQGLSRLQYDLKYYFMGKGIRAIGWHFRYLRFPETEDYFMLNRILLLIAEFLEAHPNSASLSTDSVLGQDNLFEELAELEAANLLQATDSSSDPTAAPSVTDSSISSASSEERTRVDENCVQFDGDPDLEASLALALRLQQEEYMMHSDSSSSESGVDLHVPRPAPSYLSSSAPLRFATRSMSMAETERFWHGNSQRYSRRGGGRKYQRSASCRYPTGSSQAGFPYPPDNSNFAPPFIRSFSLDFHCEFDETTQVVYGSGGALFATICRVVCQLKALRSLYLRNLFLSPFDARKLILEVSRVAGPSLERISLLHVSKITFERPSFVPQSSINNPATRIPSYYQPETSHDQYWYLNDSRWLSARPIQLGYNPLADIASLFPNLRRLELSLTQLTGPMLLRLCYQTQLLVLTLTQTDLSPRPSELVPDEYSPLQNSGILENPNFDDLNSHLNEDLGDILVDWGADVPTVRYGDAHRASVSEWRPISAEFWKRALQLRPFLQVFVKIRFMTPSPASELRVFALPSLPAPVTSIVCVLGSGDQTANYRLFEKCLAEITRYAGTLTSLVFLADVDLDGLLDKEKEQQLRPTYLSRYRPRRQITPTKDISPRPLDDNLLRLLSTCPYVSQLGLGGRLVNAHLTTMGQICRQLVRASRQTLASPLNSVAFRQPSLHMDSSSMRLEARPLPASTTSRDASTFAELMRDGKGKEVTTPAARVRAAECFIGASMKFPRWRFMQTGEFRNYVLSL